MAVTIYFVLLALATIQVRAQNLRECGCPGCEECFSLFTLTILGVNLWLLLLGVTVFVFVFVFVLWYLLAELKLIKESDESETFYSPIVMSRHVPTRTEATQGHSKELAFRVFHRVGQFCTTNEVVVILIAAVLLGLSSQWLKEADILTDPVSLWSPPNSEVFKQHTYFETHFNPISRKSHVIVSYHGSLDESSGAEPPLSQVLSKQVLDQVLSLQNQIADIKIWDDTTNGYVTFQDVCETPLGPKNKTCEISSVLNYWQNSQERLDRETTLNDGTKVSYTDHFKICVRNVSLWDDGTVLQLPCVGPLGQPVIPEEVLGGFEGSSYGRAKALFVAIPLKGYNRGDSRLRQTLLWEGAFLDFMKDFKLIGGSSGILNVSYSAERSRDDVSAEVDATSTALTILVAYTAMFVYMAFTLGEDQAVNIVAINMKIIVSLAGILLILGSVVAAFGIVSYFGYVISMLAVQIVPFLTLAVGSVNVFVLMQKYQVVTRLIPDTSDETHGDRLAVTLGLAAPSITAATVSEAVAFLLASIFTDTPAIKTFAFSAAISVMINLVLQLTVLISVTQLSYLHRQMLCDLMSCVERKLEKELELDDEEQQEEETVEKKAGKIYTLVTKFYIPLLTNKTARFLVVIVTTVAVYFCLCQIGEISLGLEEVVIPQDSYLKKYNADRDTFANIGSEVFFVVKEGFDYSTEESQNKICSVLDRCQTDSLASQINRASINNKSTQIAQGATAWLDNYLLWIDPTVGCCHVSESGKFCNATADNNATCLPCEDESSAISGNPSMARYLEYFLQSVPTKECPAGGKLLSNSVSREEDGTIKATYLSTYNTPMSNATEYINAYVSAKYIGEDMEDVLNRNENGDVSQYKVFAYSDFYIYYAHYENLVISTIKSLAATLCVMCLVKGLLLGLSFIVAPLVTGVLVLFTISMMGTLVFLGVTFSEVTLVNIIICAGIASELFTHIAANFSSHTQSSNTYMTRLERTEDTVANTGTTHLTGGVIPKLLAIFGLALIKSDLVDSSLFTTYLVMIGQMIYFGLVFIPVVLSYVGTVDRPTSAELSLLTPISNDDQEVGEATPLNATGNQDNNGAVDGVGDSEATPLNATDD